MEQSCTDLSPVEVEAIKKKTTFKLSGNEKSVYTSS